ncbi:MAG TPA: hypothetical protein VI297_05470 [Gemmatimonadales bacterium]
MCNVYITAELGLPAHNARRDAAGLVARVREALTSWAQAAAGAGAVARGARPSAQADSAPGRAPLAPPAAAALAS